MSQTEKSSKTTTVSLVHGRYRQLFWGLALIPLAYILIVNFGLGGKLLGAFCAYNAIMNLIKGFKTFSHPAGTFNITNETVTLPTALCSGEHREVATKEIRHAYILRRHTPWNRTGPMMVIECENAVYSYSRDWFGSDNDQNVLRIRSIGDAI